MKFKNGVDPKDLSAPAWYGLWVCDDVYQHMKGGAPVVCTSTGEAKHSVKHSKHYNGDYGKGFSNAFDLRIWHLGIGNQLTEFVVKCREALGRDYTIIAESNHVHVHWGPVYHG